MSFSRCAKCGGQQIHSEALEEGFLIHEEKCLQCGFTVPPGIPPSINDDDGRRRKRGGYQLGPRA